MRLPGEPPLWHYAGRIGWMQWTLLGCYPLLAVGWLVIGVTAHNLWQTLLGLVWLALAAAHVLAHSTRIRRTDRTAPTTRHPPDHQIHPPAW